MESQKKSFKINALQAAVLLFHIFNYEEADNDAEQSVNELVRSLEHSVAWIPKSVLESGLYCVNMMQEDGRYWHPQGKSLDTFLDTFFSDEEKFDKFYHLIMAKDGK